MAPSPFFPPSCTASRDLKQQASARASAQAYAGASGGGSASASALAQAIASGSGSASASAQVRSTPQSKDMKRLLAPVQGYETTLHALKPHQESKGVSVCMCHHVKHMHCQSLCCQDAGNFPPPALSGSGPGTQPGRQRTSHCSGHRTGLRSGGRPDLSTGSILTPPDYTASRQAAPALKCRACMSMHAPSLTNWLFPVAGAWIHFKRRGPGPRAGTGIR